MPDVGRSDSQRSDSSQRPRVSFNRDVHIKRIGRSEGGVVAALTSDGEGHLIATPVRRERGQRSRSELAKEAALILKQADQVQSVTAVPPGGIPPSSYNSLDRSKLRKRKTPVQQLFSEENKDLKNNEKFNTGRRLTRSVSDVGKGSLRNKYKDKSERDESEDRKRDEKKLSIFATLDRRLRKGRKENEKPSHKNEKLSPILEDENNKGNPFNFPPKIIIEPSTPIDERYKYNNEYQNQLSNYKFNKTIDEKPPPRRKLKENFQRNHSPKNIEENEESGQDTYSTISVNEFYDSKGKKNKSLLKDLHKKNISNNKHPINNEGKFQKFDDKMYDNFSVSNEKDTQEKRKDVKRIVRELSQRDTSRISPPKSSINALVDPTVDADRQHNMNRPFSYIHPNTSPTDTDQVIYAQVVCTGGDKPNEEVIKRTIHTTVDRRINTGIEEDEGGQLEEDANMKINDNNILDHLSLRRDRLESRIDSHKRRFQQNLLHNTSNNYNENRYIVPNDTGTVDNLGSITDLTTKDRYFEHHIKTTASFRHKEFLSDSPSPTAIDHKQRHSSNSEYSYKQHNKRQDQRQQKQPDDDYYHIQHSKQQQQQNKSNEKNNKDLRKKTTKLDKVRQLVSWNKKNKSQTSTEETDPVKARYMEYKGNNYSNENNVKDAEYYANRRRAATPVKNDSTWFKSLTRRSKQKDRKVATPLPEEDSVDYQSDRHYGGSKTLRFFGDSDKESFQSSNTSHQQMRNSRVRPPPDSSAESTLEDESGQSQKSVVYLHAAAVGDIPGSRKLHRSQLSNGRRALSREELSSNGSTTFVPHTRTLSRSISVLAPWKPRHPRDGIEVNYNDAGKPPRGPIKTATKTPSKPEKKKHKDGTLGRRGSDESKKSSSAFSQESASSSRRNNYNMDTVDSSNTNSLNRRLKKTNSENDLTNSTQTVHGHSKTAGWFKSRK